MLRPGEGQVEDHSVPPPPPGRPRQLRQLWHHLRLRGHQQPQTPVF